MWVVAKVKIKNLNTFKKRNKVVLCVPNTLIHYFTKKLNPKIFLLITSASR